MKIILAVLFAVALANLAAPDHPEGYQMNVASNRQVTLDVYEDLLCTDCQRAHPQLMAFLNEKDSTGTPYMEQVEVTLHYFPLPYHTHAYAVTKGVEFTYSKTGDVADVVAYSEWVYDNLSTF